MLSMRSSPPETATMQDLRQSLKKQGVPPAVSSPRPTGRSARPGLIDRTPSEIDRLGPIPLVKPIPPFKMEILRPLTANLRSSPIN